jgi:hypothetical protein
MTSEAAPGAALGTTDATTYVLVAGTAGGVGVTTVTALLFAALGEDRAGAPLLLDHSAGELGLRLPSGDDVRQVNRRLALHDLGPHADVAVARLAERHTLLVLVAPATPAGCAALDRLLSPHYGQPRSQRILVVVAGVFGRHRITTQLQALGQRIGVRSVVELPQDLALAAGGRIPIVQLGAGALRAQQHLTTVLQERLRVV